MVCSSHCFYASNAVRKMLKPVVHVCIPNFVNTISKYIYRPAKLAKNDSYCAVLKFMAHVAPLVNEASECRASQVDELCRSFKCDLNVTLPLVSNKYGLMFCLFGDKNHH